MRAALVFLVVCGAVVGSASAGSATGVGGVLYRGPITPVCRQGTPCDAPAVGVTLVFSRAGMAFRVRTTKGGHFSVALKPGVYSVRVIPATVIGSGITPRTVRVPAAGWARIRLVVDTGIR